MKPCVLGWGGPLCVKPCGLRKGGDPTGPLCVKPCVLGWGRVGDPRGHLTLSAYGVCILNLMLLFHCSTTCLGL